jgi:hypothetical protein
MAHLQQHGHTSGHHPAPAARSGTAPYELVSPYPSEASPITATAWGLQLQVATATDPRLVEFIRNYAGGAQGGEPGADCAHGSTLDQATAAVGAGYRESPGSCN